MRPSRLYSLSVFACAIRYVTADAESDCRSSGVDFVDGQSYFINSLSSDPFTCVSTFSGCRKGFADVLLVDPAGDEFLCSQVPTENGPPEMSTCPILKNQMASGDWIILILGNNADGWPFAWQRADFKLDCGPQATVTYVPTVTFNVTSTPLATATSMSTVTAVETFGPTTTVTIPKKTAHRTKTIYPSPVTITSTKVFTKNRVTFSKSLSIVTKTVTATCTVPTPGKRDKKCTYSPTMIHPKALATPIQKTQKKPPHRYVRDRAVDVEYARQRIEMAKQKRDLKNRAAAKILEERAPDAPTFTVTADTPVNMTVTYTADTATQTETQLTTTTSSTTLPPVTVYSGVHTQTVVLPTPTRTRFTLSHTTVYTTKTIVATFTKKTTVTPSASLKECRRRGGHYWGRY
ncbi:hypothetical protein GQ43DRAFT_378079 [Delitschia confertaspora ATCC 74209]|uniref:Uncharacterized protein n=1 Tax=Delitschia confertaspora ATCC 74209 TaxID=1513339 RepID=A0A9P4JI31_9PLEO|nr:hypothetical protein GQ43DRAFT_378079 [Delitschia confertaspora ATCC 74209]